MVYFDVTTGKSCDTYTEENSNTGYNGIDDRTGNQNGCLKFYIFNDYGNDTINLLLDHNTTSKIAWNSSGSNASGPKEVLEQLKMDTDAWAGTETPENYSIDQSEQESQAKYEVNYSEYKARLITANEIAEITGNTTWNERIATDEEYFYFDTNTTTASTTCTDGDTSGCSYGWLYDRTNTSCTDRGCLNNSDEEIYGYWTVSPNTSISNYAWFVNKVGSLYHTSVGYISDYYIGLRPVIEVLKSKLN